MEGLWVSSPKCFSCHTQLFTQIFAAVFFFFISALKTLVISSVNESPVHYRKYIPAGISLPHHVLFLNEKQSFECSGHQKQPKV